MKVEIAHEILKSAQTAAIQKGEKPQTGRFGDILRETMGATSSPGPGVRGPSLATPLGGISLDPFSLSTETPVLEQTERLLDTLEAYRQKLGDRQVASKEMDSLINEIERQSGGLTSTVDALPEGDPLREITNQALIVSSLEVLRYNRGDYDAT